MAGFFNSRVFRVYIVPGAVFQSVMVAGGYGTGREMVEYFTSYGFLGGLLGLAVSFVTLGVIMALTFEFARLFRVYDYRHFFLQLTGRGWILYEILIILAFLLILAVLAAAAGNILRDKFGLPYGIGLSVMLVVIGVLTFFGRELITRALTYWSFFLYAVFIAFFLSVFSGNWGLISEAFSSAEILDGWWQNGLQYGLYNVAAAPLLLYVARVFETRAEAFSAGAIAGAIAIVPAVIFQFAFFVAYPEILDQAIPTYWLMEQLGMTVLMFFYSIMLFGTFIETGAGMLQGIIERIDAWLMETRGRRLSRTAHAMLAISSIVISALFSLWGITNLIAKGFGTMAWLFLLIYVIPLITVGVYRIVRTNRF